MMRSRILLVAALALLGSCGREADLRPAPGQPMPVKPLTATATPTVNELLAVPTYAKPDRVDELVTRSKPRSSDEFDLPPPNGGGAASVPAGTAPGPQANDIAPEPPGE